MTRGVAAVARTIRFRITAVAVVALVVVLAAAAAGLVVQQERVLTDSLEESLAEQADVLAGQVAAGEIPEVLAPQGDDDTVAQLVTGAGEVLAASRNLAGRPPITDRRPAPGTAELTTVDHLGDSDEDFRLVARGVDAPGGDAQWVYVASPLDDIEDSIAVLVRSLLVALPAVCVALAALVWWLVGRTLRPVEAIRCEVAAIGGQDLDRRVPEPGTGDEVARLARTMNEMLGRVEASSLRQRQFVADASHELRTPLTRMRAELEVDVAHPGTADRAATHRSLLEETVALQRMVDDLLLLAREDAGPAVGDHEPVDLDDLVLDEVRRLRAAGGVVVDAAGVSAAQVRGNAEELRRVVRNLAENAVRHAGSTVRFGLGDAGGHAVLTVADDGPGVPVGDRERVFERFTRLDGARHADEGGSGLGLAITRAIVERHGGTVTVDDAPGGGARFAVRLATSLPDPG